MFKPSQRQAQWRFFMFKKLGIGLALLGGTSVRSVSTFLSPMALTVGSNQ